MSDLHVPLIAGESRGRPVFEPVHVAQVHEGIYRVLFTPGLVYGIAADDEIELLGDGQFNVVRRGQNLAVRVLSEAHLTQLVSVLEKRVQLLGGRLDGQVERGLAFTIPVVAGFQAVEALFNLFISEHPGSIWEYGNVYDAQDQPLGWWPAGV